MRSMGGHAPSSTVRKHPRSRGLHSCPADGRGRSRTLRPPQNRPRDRCRIEPSRGRRSPRYCRYLSPWSCISCSSCSRRSSSRRSPSLRRPPPRTRRALKCWIAGAVSACRTGRGRAIGKPRRRRCPKAQRGRVMDGGRGVRRLGRRPTTLTSELSAQIVALVGEIAGGHGRQAG